MNPIVKKFSSFFISVFMVAKKLFFNWVVFVYFILKNSNFRNFVKTLNLKNFDSLIKCKNILKRSQNKWKTTSYLESLLKNFIKK